MGTIISNFLGVQDTQQSSAKFEVLKFLGLAMGGTLVALQAFASYKRSVAVENTAKAQVEANRHTEQGQRQERLKNAIEHLGSEEESVRLGGSYELFHLVRPSDAKDLRQTVLDILCAHIRTKTTEKKDQDSYQSKYQSKPSAEIQSLLNLLFREKEAVFRGLHIDLQDSWLNGADLREARLSEAVLTGVYLQGANLRKARLQWADLQRAQLQDALLPAARLQGAFLQHARLQGASLEDASLQYADLQNASLNNAHLDAAQLQGANLEQTRLKGARLGEAWLQGADLWNAQLQGANLWDARLQGANLWNAQLQGAFLRGAQMQGANLWNAQLQGAHLEEAELRGIICHHDQFRQLPFVMEPGQLRPAVRDLRFALQEQFRERIRQGVGRDSDLSIVIFEGGMTQEAVDNLVQDFPDEEAENLRDVLRPHVGQPPSQHLPRNCHASRLPYTEEDAKRWIDEYEENVRDAEWEN